MHMDSPLFRCFSDPYLLYTGDDITDPFPRSWEHKISNLLGLFADRSRSDIVQTLKRTEGNAAHAWEDLRAEQKRSRKVPPARQLRADWPPPPKGGGGLTLEAIEAHSNFIAQGSPGGLPGSGLPGPGLPSHGVPAFGITITDPNRLHHAAEGQLASHLTPPLSPRSAARTPPRSTPACHSPSPLAGGLAGSAVKLRDENGHLVLDCKELIELEEQIIEQMRPHTDGMHVTSTSIGNSPRGLVCSVSPRTKAGGGAKELAKGSPSFMLKNLGTLRDQVLTPHHELFGNRVAAPPMWSHLPHAHSPMLSPRDADRDRASSDGESAVEMPADMDLIGLDVPEVYRLRGSVFSSHGKANYGRTRSDSSASGMSAWSSVSMEKLEQFGHVSDRLGKHDHKKLRKRFDSKASTLFDVGGSFDRLPRPDGELESPAETMAVPKSKQKVRLDTRSNGGRTVLMLRDTDQKDPTAVLKRDRTKTWGEDDKGAKKGDDLVHGFKLAEHMVTDKAPEFSLKPIAVPKRSRAERQKAAQLAAEQAEKEKNKVVFPDALSDIELRNPSARKRHHTMVVGAYGTPDQDEQEQLWAAGKQPQKDHRPEPLGPMFGKLLTDIREADEDDEDAFAAGSPLAAPTVPPKAKGGTRPTPPPPRPGSGKPEAFIHGPRLSDISEYWDGNADERSDVGSGGGDGEDSPNDAAAECSEDGATPPQSKSCSPGTQSRASERSRASHTLRFEDVHDEVDDADDDEDEVMDLGQDDDPLWLPPGRSPTILPLQNEQALTVRKSVSCSLRSSLKAPTDSLPSGWTPRGGAREKKRVTFASPSDVARRAVQEHAARALARTIVESVRAELLDEIEARRLLREEKLRGEAELRELPKRLELERQAEQARQNAAKAAATRAALAKARDRTMRRTSSPNIGKIFGGSPRLRQQARSGDSSLGHALPWHSSNDGFRSHLLHRSSHLAHVIVGDFEDDQHVVRGQFVPRPRSQSPDREEDACGGGGAGAQDFVAYLPSSDAFALAP